MAIEKARSSFFDKERHQNERNNRYLHQPRTHGLAACIALLCERGQRPEAAKQDPAPFQHRIRNHRDRHSRPPNEYAVDSYTLKIQT